MDEFTRERRPATRSIEDWLAALTLCIKLCVRSRTLSENEPALERDESECEFVREAEPDRERCRGDPSSDGRGLLLDACDNKPTLSSFSAASCEPSGSGCANAIESSKYESSKSDCSASELDSADPKSPARVCALGRLPRGKLTGLGDSMMLEGTVPARARRPSRPGWRGGIGIPFALIGLGMSELVDVYCERGECESMLSW